MGLLRTALTMIARVLLGIAIALGIASVGWSALQHGMQQGGEMAGDLVASLTQSLGDAYQQAVDQLGQQTEQVVAQSVQGIGAFAFGNASAAQVETALELGSGGATSADSFPDAALGALYQDWKDDIDAPIARVFAGTSINSEVLGGVAGGSVTAIELLDRLDDVTLDTVASNAQGLSITASSHQVPVSLPQDARDHMSLADGACVEFCWRAQDLVAAVRELKRGNLTAYGPVSSAALNAKGALETMDANMLAAESLLGAA